MRSKFRDGDGDPQLHLFGQLKRITRQWMDHHFTCAGEGVNHAQLLYPGIADVACNKINDAIVRAGIRDSGPRVVKAVLDPYTPLGSTAHVNFNTSRLSRYDTAGPPPRSHLNWVILDSDWEAEFCRVAEAHPRVRSYVKNHGLGFEVPYLHGRDARIYRPDFIVRLDDGRGDPAAGDLLNLVVEVKGYRGEDAKEKAATMTTRWGPGVTTRGTFGRWDFAEFCDPWGMQMDFEAKVEEAFGQMIGTSDL